MAEMQGDEAFAQLLRVKIPGIDDFKQLALLEAAGELFYEGLAAQAPNESVRSLLARNGQEEMGHAHRLRKVVKLLYGEDFRLPARADNPFCAAPVPQMSITRETLTAIAQGEAEGETFYEGWAGAVANAEAAKLLRLNGKEEARHGTRITEAIGLLPQ